MDIKLGCRNNYFHTDGIMFKKIGLFVLMSGFAMQLQAAQCPPASVFSHVKGQPWTLSARAHLEGWRMTLITKEANDSEHTEISKNGAFDASLTEYWFQNTEALCVYTISPTGYAYVAISNIRQVDMKSIPQPPFEKGLDNMEYYICLSTNSNPEICTWNWKH